MPTRLDSPRFIRAAGGIVWRDEDHSELAIIYRDRYFPGECCLPKGKLEESESWGQAALREVKEETGCDAQITGFAGLLHYHIMDKPKVVVVFEMQAIREGEFEPAGEVVETAWMEPQEAVSALTHEPEQELLQNYLEQKRAGDIRISH